MKAPRLPVMIEGRHAEVLEEARVLARAVEPMAIEADESSVIHQPMADALAASGLCSLMVPAKYGGRFETVDPLAACLVREALMKTSSHIDSLFALQGIGSYAISMVGSEEQREKWLPAVGRCEARAALALTEPVAGSDLKSVRTKVTARDGDLIVEGSKSFISNAGEADFYTTLVREDDGHSLILIPADADGVTVTPAPEIIATLFLSLMCTPFMRSTGFSRLERSPVT